MCKHVRGREGKGRELEGGGEKGEVSIIVRGRREGGSLREEGRRER